MGVFDEVIREHLELRRKQGVSEQDLERQEQEALGKGAPPAAAPDASEQLPQPPPVEDVAEPGAGDSEPDPAEEPPEPTRAAPAESDEPEPEPDEVLPDESLGRTHEDVLEETPEFFEETPEQDHLWFEQRTPKDFDFGD